MLKDVKTIYFSVYLLLETKAFECINRLVYIFFTLYDFIPESFNYLPYIDINN